MLNFLLSIFFVWLIMNLLVPIMNISSTCKHSKTYQLLVYLWYMHLLHSLILKPVLHHCVVKFCVPFLGAFLNPYSDFHRKECFFRER